MRKVIEWATACALLTLSMTSGLQAQTAKKSAGAAAGAAQTNKDPEQMSREELFATIEKLDAELFDAYNRCDLEKFASFFPEQLEFYHDRDGLSATTREQLVAAIKQNICGKVHRELIKSSLEVDPMHKYGAVELGTHRFTHPGIDNDSGEAKFVMLWKWENGKWTVPRVISYERGSRVHHRDTWEIGPLMIGSSGH